MEIQRLVASLSRPLQPSPEVYTGPAILKGPEGDPLKGMLNVDVDVDLFKAVSISAQVLLNGIGAVMVLTLTVLKQPALF